jgi:lipopolysaccharide/colanic/teichoic acid biosynthesis glycosyltransferase
VSAKRLFDAVASAVGLAVLAVPMALLGMAVVLDSGKPALFRQTRIGRHGVPFMMLKFRTMAEGAEAAGRLSVGRDPRITRVGRILRKYKLDELPQLVNVLRGDMSIVGPRPEVPEYAHVYPAQDEVWSVRPGITDPTAILLFDEARVLANAVDAESYYVEVLLPKKTQRYLEYVRSRTFSGDLKLIISTLGRILGVGRQRGRHGRA